MALVNCLICGTGMDETKPLVRSENERWTDFKTSFQCFCQLLSVAENDNFEELLDRLIADPSGAPEAFQIPCCGECCGALKDIQRLQKEIEELKVSQMSRVEELKCSLRSSEKDTGFNDLNNEWCLIRKQIFSSVLQQSTDELRVAEEETLFCDEVIIPSPPPLPPQKQMPRKRKLVEVMEGTVKKTNLQGVTPPVEQIKEEQVEIVTDDKPSRPRRSTRKIVNLTEKESDSSDEDFVPSPAQETGSDDDDYTPPIRQEPTPTKKRMLSPKIPVKSKRVVTKLALKTTINEYFSQLTDSLLLYKFTLITLTPGEGLSCQEPGCSPIFLTKGTDLTSFEQMKEHVKSSHLPEDHGKSYPRKPRPCPLCKEDPPLQGPHFRNHLLSKDHGPPPYLCHVCWKPIKKCQDMPSHLKSHLGPQDATPVSRITSPRKMFSCDQCGKSFPKMCRLRKHQEIHLPKSSRETWSCDQCPAKLWSENALKSHMERQHVAPELKKYVGCPICDKQFFVKDRAKLALHIRIHRNERPFVCDICGKAFPDKGHLKNHQKNVHTEEMNFQCEYCEMNYKTNKSLRRHQVAVHKMEKGPLHNVSHVPSESSPDFIGPRIAFPCDYCDKLFQLKCRLTQHLKKYHA